MDGDISINDNGSEDMVRAQNNLGIETDNGAVTISGKIATTDGDIEFKKISADNADIKTINGSVTADTITADDTIRIEIECGNLYLNLAQIGQSH